MRVWPVQDAKARFSEFLDTDVVSELRRQQPHGAVVAWLQSKEAAGLPYQRPCVMPQMILDEAGDEVIAVVVAWLQA